MNVDEAEDVEAAIANLRSGDAFGVSPMLYEILNAQLEAALLTAKAIGVERNHKRAAG